MSDIMLGNNKGKYMNAFYRKNKEGITITIIPFKTVASVETVKSITTLSNALQVETIGGKLIEIRTDHDAQLREYIKYNCFY